MSYIGRLRREGCFREGRSGKKTNWKKMGTGRGRERDVYDDIGRGREQEMGDGLMEDSIGLEMLGGP